MHVCNLVSLRFAPGYHHSVSTGPLVTHTVWVTKGPVETEDTDQTARFTNMSNCKFACAPAHAFEHSSHTQCTVQILLILLLRLGILLFLGLGIRITGVEDLTEAERWRSKSNRLQLCQCLLLLLRNLLSYPTGILGMPYRNIRRRLVRPLRWWWLPNGGTGLRGTLMKLLWLCGL